MGADFQVILRVVAIGVGATVVLDLWSAGLKRTFKIPSTNWAMVGRWIGHMPGLFVHTKLSDASPVRGELQLGWCVHYAIGIGFATILVGIGGSDWLRQPTVVPALMVGVCTVVFPFFILQPGMGLGVAASDCMWPPWDRRNCSRSSMEDETT